MGLEHRSFLLLFIRRSFFILRACHLVWFGLFLCNKFWPGVLSGTNRCPSGSQCSPWSEIFPTAQSMCEKIWSNSYKYTTLTKNSGRCMQMWFDPPNPNKKVAEFYLSGAMETVTLSMSLHLISFLMIMLAWKQKYT